MGNITLPFLLLWQQESVGNNKLTICCYRSIWVCRTWGAGRTRVGAKGCDEGEEDTRLFLVKVA